MLDIYATFATDSNLENNGTWRQVGSAKLLIARLNNPNYSKLLSKLFEQHRAALDIEGPEADALSDKIMVEVMAKTILLGWENVGFKGQPRAYSTEAAMELLSVKDFRLKVRALSDEMDSYLIREENKQGEALSPT